MVDFLRKKTILIAFIALGVLGASFSSFAAGGESEHGEGFDATSLIMHHISDDYQWHIAGDIYLPLPVILYSTEDGLSVFLSSKFKSHSGHGHEVAVAEGHEGHEHTSTATEEGTTEEHAEATSHHAAGYAPYHGYQYDAHHATITRVDGGEFYNFSITKNVTSMLFSVLILFLLFIPAANAYGKRKGQAPKGLQSFLEPLVVFVRDEIAKASLGEKIYRKYTPYLLTLFFFIWLNNLMGLLPIFPGSTNVSGNIAFTFTLAFISFIVINVSGNKHYWTHILWPPGIPVFLKPILIVVEFAGIFTKPFALMIRLFANITGGHVVVLSIVSLIFILGPDMGAGGVAGLSVGTIAFTVFMYCIKLLVAALQAFIFTLLTALFIAQATEEAHHGPHEEDALGEDKVPVV